MFFDGHLSLLEKILLISSQEANELSDGSRSLRVQIFALLHVLELLMKLRDQSDEFIFFGLFAAVELDDPLLQDIQQRVHAVVVGLLLRAGGKT